MLAEKLPALSVVTVSVKLYTEDPLVSFSNPMCTVSEALNPLPLTAMTLLLLVAEAVNVPVVRAPAEEVNATAKILQSITKSKAFFLFWVNGFFSFILEPLKDDR